VLSLELVSPKDDVGGWPAANPRGREGRPRSGDLTEPAIGTGGGPANYYLVNLYPKYVWVPVGTCGDEEQ
jgi:hypothetical protein